MNIIITANSPGEVAGWARPLIREISQNIKDSKVFLFLLPCSFASGREFDFSRNIEGLAGILKPVEILSLIFLGKKPDFIDFKKKGVIIHLGGDLFFTSRLASRINYPAFAYIWANKLWDKKFCGYFARDFKGRQRLIDMGVLREKIHVVGELLMDNFSSLDVKKEGFTISFMPGSRMMEIKLILPFYLEVAWILKDFFKDINFKLILSPFIDLKKFYEKTVYLPDKKMGGIEGRLSLNKDEIVSDKVSIKIITDNHYKCLLSSDMVVTIPGTKTGEAGIAGVPMLVVLPLNRAEVIPHVGLIGLLDWMGKPAHLLKALLIKSIAKRFGFVSQPNIIAGRKIVPEMVGELTPLEVAEEAIELIRDKKKVELMKKELEIIYKPLEGASQNIIKLLRDMV